MAPRQIALRAWKEKGADLKLRVGFEFFKEKYIRIIENLENIENNGSCLG